MSGVARVRIGCLVAALLVGGLLAAGVGPATPPAAADDPPAYTPHPISFGAFAERKWGTTSQQAVTELEQKIGRTLQTVRVFDLWEDPFPDAYATFLRDGGRTIILSIKPKRRNGTVVPWSALASAAPGSALDGEIRSWARRIRDFGAPVYVTMTHEPETSGNQVFGTAPDFIAAWRHWVDVFREEGATNVRFMWIMTDYAHMVWPTARNYAATWYPGDAYVDSMGIDAYNWFTCRNGQDNPWKSLATIIEPFRQFGLRHPGKDLWLTEWASGEDPNRPGRKATWVDDARALFAQPAYAQFAGVSYYSWYPQGTPTDSCVFKVDTSEASLASFAAMAVDPLFGGSAWAVAAPSPPNVAPSADFTSSCTWRTCTFTSTSTDPDGQVTDTAWSLGQDPAAVGGTPATYTFPAAGTYAVTLTVTDDDGATATRTRQVTVDDPVVQPVTFVAAAESHANTLTHKVVVPAGVQQGDALLLGFTANTTATVTTPTQLGSWRSLGAVTKSTMTSRMWSLAAPAGAAGKTISVPVSVQSKGNLVLSVYRGTSPLDPVASATGVGESAVRTTHTTPAADVTEDRGWVVWYWAQKDSGTTLLHAPADVTVRSSSTGSPSGRIAGLLADSGAPAGVGPVAGRVATADIAKSDAAMWTVVLAPAPAP